MSSGSDDRRNDPTVFGGSGAPDQPDAQWQRPGAVNPPGAPAPGNPPAGQPNPDPTTVWTPGGTGLPPTLRWDGSGPPPGLPDPTPWTPAGPQQWGAPAPGQADATQLRNPAAPWPGANPPGAPMPGQPMPGQADPTQLRTPAAWPDPNAASGQQGLGQAWGGPPQPQWGTPPPGQNQWNPAAGQPNPQWGSGGQAWQQPQQQYGEVPPLEQFGNQPYGQPPYGQPPKSGNKAAIWVAAGVAAVLLAGGAITAFALTRGDDEPTTTAAPTPSMVSALTTTGAPPSSSKPKPSSTTPSPTGAASDRKPLIEGYQVVASPDRGAAYDVPPSWKVATETTIGGVGEPPGDTVIGKGYASEGRDYCPGSTRTMSFLTGSKQADHGAAGAELGTKAAPLAYSGATGKPGPAQPLTSIDGKTDGMFTETTGTVANPKPGCGPTFSIYTYAFKGTKDGSFVMVMIADTGVPDAVDAAAAKRIFSSIRALN
ncbi:hypothetical protein ACIGO9_35510 [Nocardia asteroides]|uniref:hypothetical protein n=1 Tax=Nocardia asteroides TaxID=1824 RepID=UPI00343DABE3